MITPEDSERMLQSHLRSDYEQVMGELLAGRITDEEAFELLNRLLDLLSAYETKAAPIYAEYEELPALEKEMTDLTENFNPAKKRLRTGYCLESQLSTDELAALEAECKLRHTELNAKISHINNLDIDLWNLQSKLIRAGRVISFSANDMDIGELMEDYDDLNFSITHHPNLAEKRRELVELWKKFTPQQRNDFKKKMVAKGWNPAELNELLRSLYLE